MKAPGALVILVLSAALAWGCAAPAPAPPAPEAAQPVAASEPPAPDVAHPGETPCEPVGDVRFICDLISPEDLAVLPGDEWVIASGNRAGGRLHVINVADRTATAVFPTPQPSERFDAAAWPTCPGPLGNPADADFQAHGLHLAPEAGGVHTLYVVHHGARESVEVFEVDTGPAQPALTWVGCVPALSTMRLNSVAPLPDGGLAGTNTNHGDVWAWRAGAGWSRIPGTEDSASNGVEISADGRWLYVAGWSEEKLTRVSLDQTPVQRDVISLPFRPDNVRMSADRSALYAAGHTDRDGQSITDPRAPLTESSNVARIDPETLEFEVIFRHPALAGFVATTTGVPVGDELWLGSHRGERVAWLPLPR